MRQSGVGIRDPRVRLCGQVCAIVRCGHVAWVEVRSATRRPPQYAGSRHLLRVGRLVRVLGDGHLVMSDAWGQWILPRGTELRPVRRGEWPKLGF